LQDLKATVDKLASMDTVQKNKIGRSGGALVGSYRCKPPWPTANHELRDVLRRRRRGSREAEAAECQGAGRLRRGRTWAFPPPVWREFEGALGKRLARQSKKINIYRVRGTVSCGQERGDR